MRRFNINQTRGLNAPPTIAALLMPTENWDQRRADANAQMAIQNQLTQVKQQEQQNLLTQRALIEAEFNKVRDLDLLQPDKERVNYMADSFEEAIIKKVKEKYNGNLKNYLNTEAVLDQSRFANMLKKSDALQYGLVNKNNVAEYKKAREEGLVPRSINGRSFESVYEDFRSGRVKKIEYNGAFKPSKNFAKPIVSTYGSDRYTMQAATKAEVIQGMMLDGLSMEDANDQYNQMNLDSFPIYHKYDDAYDKAEYLMKMQRNKAAIEKSRASTANSNGNFVDVVSSVFRDVLREDQVAFKIDGVTPTRVNRSISRRLSGSIGESLMDSIGASKIDKESNIFTFGRGIDGQTLDGNKVPVKNFLPEDVVTMADGNGNEQYYIRGSALVSEDDAKSEGWDFEGVLMTDNVIGGSRIKKTAGGVFEDNQYLVDNILISYNGNASPIAQAAVTKKANLKSSHVTANPLNSIISYD